MIRLIAITILLVLAGSTVHANPNNEALKLCLDAYGYNLKNFDTFDFSKAAACHSNKKEKKKIKLQEEQREFLKKRPWFRGTNWKWEEKAEYTCTKQYHTGLTICHKPYYIN